MKEPKSYPQLNLLADFLEELDIPEKTKIQFCEDPSHENRYALSVESDNEQLINSLAKFWGCPDEELPEGDSFEASDEWHGEGNGNLRELADEITQEYESFFDVSLTVTEIKDLADSGAQD